MLKALALVASSIVFMATASLAQTARADEGDPTIDDCMKAFAKDYVPEYNLENEYIFSTDKAAKQGVVDVMKTRYVDWLVSYASSTLKFADAVGAVFNYGDETHIIYTAINIEGGKCQVRELVDLNTVDTEKSEDQTLLSKYCLNKSLSELPEPVQEFVYDDIRKALAGIED